ncbi:MAG TPA: hypothetical protein VFK69_01995 [Candidatus Eisenbacteria bacterium]|nr:hypothetical protein [Candidatus Eisenbacteria bacterium]
MSDLELDVPAMVGGSGKFESAQIILRLYELRREARMREARDWFVGWVPLTVDDAVAAWRGAETSPRYRMVTTYWDMAAALVNHGAIDAAMFHDTVNEHAYVFARLEPFLPGLRELSGIGDYLVQLERCVLAMPPARLAWTRGRIERAREQERQRREGAPAG